MSMLSLCDADSAMKEISITHGVFVVNKTTIRDSSVN